MGATNLGHGVEQGDVLLVLAHIEIGDPGLEGRGVMQFAPDHHLVVRARRLPLLVEAPQAGRLAVPPAGACLLDSQLQGSSYMAEKRSTSALTHRVSRPACQENVVTYHQQAGMDV